jgi:hypothetical protein
MRQLVMHTDYYSSTNCWKKIPMTFQQRFGIFHGTSKFVFIYLFIYLFIYSFIHFAVAQRTLERETL